MPTKNNVDIRSWYEKEPLYTLYRYLSDRNPFKIKNSVLVNEEHFFVADFCEEELQKYVKHDYPEKFFNQLRGESTNILCYR